MSATTPTGNKTVTRQGVGGVTCANAKPGSVCSSNDGKAGHTTSYAYNTRGDLDTVTLGYGEEPAAPPAAEGAR